MPSLGRRSNWSTSSRRSTLGDHGFYIALISSVGRSWGTPLPAMASMPIPVRPIRTFLKVRVTLTAGGVGVLVANRLFIYRQCIFYRLFVYVPLFVYLLPIYYLLSDLLFMRLFVVFAACFINCFHYLLCIYKCLFVCHFLFIV